MKELAVLCCLVIFLCGFGSCGGSDDKNSSNLSHVTYRVDSLCSFRADILYFDPLEGEKVLENVEIPWSFEFDAEPGDYTYLRVSDIYGTTKEEICTNVGKSEDCMAEITVDGKCVTSTSCSNDAESKCDMLILTNKIL